MVNNHQVACSLFNTETCFWLMWCYSYHLPDYMRAMKYSSFLMCLLFFALTPSAHPLHFTSRCDLLNRTSQCLLNSKWLHFLFVCTIISPTPTSERPLLKIKKAPLQQKTSLAIRCLYKLFPGGFCGQNLEERGNIIILAKRDFLKKIKHLSVMFHCS